MFNRYVGSSLRLWVAVGGAAAVAFSAASALAQRGVQINHDANGQNIPGDAANEPSFAIDPTNPLHMVAGWRQFPTISSDARYAGVAVSTDGGLSWFNEGTLPPPPDAPDAQQSDPVLAVDWNGVFFYNSLIFRGSHLGVATYRSDTGGFSWEEPVFSRDQSADKNWYEIDYITGNHYGIWQLPGEFARSTDGGRTWARWRVGASIFAHVNVGPDAEVYIGWWENGGVKIRRSDNAQDPNATPTFTPEVAIAFGDMVWQPPMNPDGGASQVWIATNQNDGPQRGWVYVLSSSQTGNDPADVMFSRSTDGGQTWSAPIRVNDDAPGQDYQWMAAMSMAPGGRLDAAWFDTRDDPGHLLSRLYYAHSYDGGATWSPSRPVGDQFDPRVGWPQQRKMGDYFHARSDNGSMSFVHSATYNGEQDLYFRRLHPMVLDVSPLTAGRPGQFDVSECRPNERVWIVYSLAGNGYTNVGPLDVPVNLAQPRLGVGPRFADGSGNVSWTVTMPPQSRGQHIYFQAIQRQNASNVFEADVQ